MGGGWGAPLKFRERHALRKQAHALWRPAAGSGAAGPSRQDLAAALAEAARQLAGWRELCPGDGLPVLPPGYAELAGLAAEVEGQLTALRSYIPVPAAPETLPGALAVADFKPAAVRPWPPPGLVPGRPGP